MRTFEGTAKEQEKFHPFDEVLTMKADETEREIQIGIVDDENWQPDMDFYVRLMDPETKTRLHGDDTECTVTILDEDKPGNIGFDERQIDVQRKDKVAYIFLHRKDGSDGIAKCVVNTVSEVEGVPGKKAAVEGKDFVPIRMKEVVFKGGEVEHRLEIEMPDCVGEQTGDGEDNADVDTVSFAVQLSNPEPAGVKLSKKATCYVNIEADDENEAQAADWERRQMLDFFLAEKEITWADQFKNACQLGPTIDQDDLIVEDVGGASALWHFLAIFWKVFGALVPPADYWGGWASFIVALALIGVITTIVGEVATVLGCVVNLKPSVAGITLVAMGTSLPDTLASKTAA